MEEVKLFGAWPSPYSYRVIWALKLKGISYEYIAEDLSNKSATLLQYNPIHKKIPVFVHGGKPIAESMVILEYIDETWPECPLLPEDPYERSIVRFWAKYADTKVIILGWFLSFGKFMALMGDERQKAIGEGIEFLKNVEEHGFREKPVFGGDSIGLADLAFGAIAHWLGVIEEALDIKLLDAQKFPRLHAWTKKLREVPVIKENLPDREQMIFIFKTRREILLAASRPF